MQWVVIQGFGTNWRVIEWLPDGNPEANHWEKDLENGEIKMCCRWEPSGDDKTGLAYDSAGFAAVIQDGAFVKWVPTDELQIS